MQRIVDDIVQPVGHGRAGAIERVALVGRLQQFAQAGQYSRIELAGIELRVELVAVAQAFGGQRAVFLVHVVAVKPADKAARPAQQLAGARRLLLQFQQHLRVAAVADKVAGTLPQRSRNLRQAAQAFFELRVIIESHRLLRHFQYFFKHVVFRVWCA